MKPLTFLRAFGCVDDQLQADQDRPVQGLQGAAGRLASAITRTRSKLAPDKPNPDPDEAQFADLPRLFTALDKLTRAPTRTAGQQRTST